VVPIGSPKDSKVRFELDHDLAAPLGLVELMLGSAALPAALAARLPAFEGIEVREYRLADGELRRTWRYQARGPVAWLGQRHAPREWMTWDEHAVYRLGDHCGSWRVVPRPEAPPDAGWRRRFLSRGSYRLTALGPDRTRRTVAGALDISIAFLGGAAERWALSELRKVYAAEADVLGRLCQQA
jgi:hypothetical protein